MIEGIPIWAQIIVLIVSGGGLHKLYSIYAKSARSIREELWERLNALEREQNRQQRAYMRLYAHVIYLEGLLVQKGISFTSFGEKEQQHQKEKDNAKEAI